MTNRGMQFPAGALVCLLLAGHAGAGETRPRVYTNEDLARVSPLRGETGGSSRPAAMDASASPAKNDPSRHADSASEEHWRRAAARHRERVAPLLQQAADLRDEIAARRREPGVRPLTDPKVNALERRLAIVEGRIREAEDRFEESARRARALPGWLR